MENSIIQTIYGKPINIGSYLIWPILSSGHIDCYLNHLSVVMFSMTPINAKCRLLAHFRSQLNQLTKYLQILIVLQCMYTQHSSNPYLAKWRSRGIFYSKDILGLLIQLPLFIFVFCKEQIQGYLSSICFQIWHNVLHLVNPSSLLKQ